MVYHGWEDDDSDDDDDDDDNDDNECSMNWGDCKSN